MSDHHDERFTRKAGADLIAQDLSGQIRCGDLAPGSRLPTEKILSEHFGVSRTVVREAIARLKSDGLVQSRQGSGAFVTPTEARRSFKLDGEILDIRNLLSLMELRQSVEVSGARLAAARWTEEDFEKIRNMHEKLIASEPWSDDEIRADTGFHYAIAFATQNRYYAEFMSFLSNILHETVKKARSESRDPKIQQTTIREHDLILKALASRDPEAAGLAMMYHLQGARDRIRHD